MADEKRTKCEWCGLVLPLDYKRAPHARAGEVADE